VGEVAVVVSDPHRPDLGLGKRRMVQLLALSAGGGADAAPTLTAPQTVEEANKCSSIMSKWSEIKNTDV